MWVACLSIGRYWRPTQINVAWVPWHCYRTLNIAMSATTAARRASPYIMPWTYATPIHVYCDFSALRMNGTLPSGKMQTKSPSRALQGTRPTRPFSVKQNARSSQKVLTRPLNIASFESFSIGSPLETTFFHLSKASP